ncbi:MAG: hypothetical protein Q4Q06_03475 [Bacteroidota bacterium]|nr:hypothetical protein [Bacteroidota bacterium]
MKSLKLIVLSFVLLSLFVSCSKGEKKVLKTYSDGKPELVAYYKQGKKVYQERYYQNGKIRSKGPFNDTIATGEWKFYFDDGKMFAQADFTKLRSGEQWQIYNNSEKIVDKTDSILTMSFSPEGTLVDISVKKDKNSNAAVYYRFFNSFRPMIRYNLVGNVFQGQALSWYENGNINSEAFYVDGMRDSTYVVYAENGQVMTRGKYKKDVKVGKWEFFNSEGKPLGVEIYDLDGTLLKESNTMGLKFSHRKKSDSTDSKQ